MPVAQIPGADQAVDAAMRSGEWTAVVLVVVMLGIIIILGWVVRTWIIKASSRDEKILDQAAERETRLAARVDGLEAYIREDLKEQHKENAAIIRENTKAMLTIAVQAAETTKALADLIEALHTTRICFATGEQQGRLVESIASKVVHEIRIKQENGT